MFNGETKKVNGEIPTCNGESAGTEEKISRNKLTAKIQEQKKKKPPVKDKR